jgi:hypothetical protein
MIRFYIHHHYIAFLIVNRKTTESLSIKNNEFLIEITIEKARMGFFYESKARIPN